MRDPLSFFGNAVVPAVPAAVSFGTADACSGGDACASGAQGAVTPQEGRSDAFGGVEALLAGAASGVSKGIDAVKRRGRGGGCCCWWVVAAAVIVVLVVAD